jgi:integrase
MGTRIIHSYNEKTNQLKDVPMNQAVYAVLSKRLRVRSITGYVFTTSNGTPYEGRNVYRAFKAAVKEAGITGRLRIHDLRHTAATRLIEAGADIYAVASVLDHSQLTTTKRYARHNNETKRRVLNALDRLPQESQVSKSYDFLTVGPNAGKE